MTDNKYLTPGDVANILSVSPVTVRQWAQKGKLKSRVTAGGHRRFLQEDVQNFADAYGHTLAEEEGNEARILIVDDDRQLSGFLYELLSTLPYNIAVEVTNDSFAAGEMVHQFKPNVILLDLMMPGMDGFAVCKRLKAGQITRDIRIIAMTGYPSQQNVERILAAGAEVCLGKPVNKDTLINAIGKEFLERCGMREKLAG